MKIANRTFIISGGSSGLGLATTRMILKEGGNVSILDRASPPSDIGAFATPTTGSVNAENLRKARVIYVPTDVLKPEEISVALEKTAEWTKETGARLGGVLNGAGIAMAEMTINVKGEPHSEKVWNKVVGVNLNGTFHLTRLAAPYLIKVEPEGDDNERGVIFMISSSAAYEGQIGQIAYSASKGALLAMTLPLAREFARYGVRVITLAPGPFTTPMTDQFSRKIEDSLLNHAMLYPKRYGNMREFTDTVKWALECTYINGENYRISGGARVPAWL